MALDLDLGLGHCAPEIPVLAVMCVAGIILRIVKKIEKVFLEKSHMEKIGCAFEKILQQTFKKT